MYILSPRNETGKKAGYNHYNPLFVFLLQLPKIPAV